LQDDDEYRRPGGHGSGRRRGPRRPGVDAKFPSKMGLGPPAARGGRAGAAPAAPASGDAAIGEEVASGAKPISDLCCASAPPVLEFDPAGNLVNHWGGPGTGFEWPPSMHGITIDGKDNVWLAGNGKSDHQVLKFTRDGKFLLQIAAHQPAHQTVLVAVWQQAPKRCCIEPLEFELESGALMPEAPTEDGRIAKPGRAPPGDQHRSFTGFKVTPLPPELLAANTMAQAVTDQREQTCQRSRSPTEQTGMPDPHSCAIRTPPLRFQPQRTERIQAACQRGVLRGPPIPSQIILLAAAVTECEKPWREL